MPDNLPMIPVIIMIVLALLMFYGLIISKKKKSVWGKTLAIFCGLAITITVIIVNTYKPVLEVEKLETRIKIVTAEIHFLAQALSEQYQGNNAKCLVIHSPVFNSEEDKLMNKLLMEETLKGFNGKVSEIRAVPIKTLLPDENPEENTAAHFNAVLQSNPDCDIVIISCSLPYDIAEVYRIDLFELIESKKEPGKNIKNPDRKYPLVGLRGAHYPLNIPEMGFSIDDDLIAAMTIGNPDVNYLEDIPEDIKSIFEKRYLLITKSNIDQISQKFPKLLNEKR